MLPTLWPLFPELNQVHNSLTSGEQTLTAILNATGKPVDAAQVKAVIEKLKGKQVHEVSSFYNRSLLLKDKLKSDQDHQVLPQPKPLLRMKRRKNNLKKLNPRKNKRNLNQNPRKKTSILTYSVDLI